MLQNEKWTAEIADMSSVKNSFWANNASEKAQNSLKRKIFKWNILPKKMNCFYSVILDN